MKRTLDHIWPDDPNVRLEGFIPDDPAFEPMAVLILPGGAYFAISDTESDQIAERFCSIGFPAYVLRYSTMHPSFDKPDSPVNLHTIFPEPLHQTGAAAAKLKKEYGKLCIIGFSAGGHLAANYCNEWSSPEIYSALALEPEEIRPDACVLCYAATQLTAASATMNMAVFGARDSYPEQLRLRWCAAENVNRSTPPTFLWHSVTDKMVPVAQTYRMAQALNDEGIMHECHIFPFGPHAIGLSEGYPAHIWPELAAEFMKRLYE